MKVDDLANVRLKSWNTATCAWAAHEWEQFWTVSIDPFLVAVLCLVCGRDPNEAISALPIVVPPAEYPELRKGR